MNKKNLPFTRIGKRKRRRSRSQYHLLLPSFRQVKREKFRKEGILTATSLLRREQEVTIARQILFSINLSHPYTSVTFVTSLALLENFHFTSVEFIRYDTNLFHNLTDCSRLRLIHFYFLLDLVFLSSFVVY